MNFRRAPDPHQLAAFEESKELEYYALFWQQRVRKTWVIINTAVYQYRRGAVNALVAISAPNGVQFVWTEEVGKDVPLDVPCLAVAWRSGGKMKTRDARSTLDRLLRFDGLAVLSMTAAHLKTAEGWKYLERFLKARRCLVCADESDWAANWSAQTRKLLSVGSRPGAVMRRITCGTPVDEGPLDVFYPAQFLSPAIFGTRKEVFANRYSEYEEEEITDPGTGRTYSQRVQVYGRGGIGRDNFIGYRNLEELHERMAGWSSRLLRSQVSSAPGPTFRSVYFELSSRQRVVYDRLRDAYLIELDRGERTVDRVLTRMIRLQMVARNYFPPDETGEPCRPCAGAGRGPDGTDCPACAGLGTVVIRAALERIDPDRNPALEALTEELARTTEPVVVWTVFRQDAADAAAALAATGRSVGRYTGLEPMELRRAAYDGFRAGTVDSLVATLSSGIIRGHDLTRAGSMIFYSNSFSLRTRSQAQDRAESLDRTISTGIVDLIAADTRDLDAIAALREKKLTSDRILGDPASTWI